MDVIVLIDVDGVVANFLGAVLDEVERVTGVRHLESAHHVYNIQEAYSFSNPLWGHIKLEIQACGFASRIKPYPGAVKGVKRLVQMGADVYFVTSPWRSSETWTWERTRWLQRRFGDTLGRKVIYTEQKHLVLGDLFIEDKPSILEKWAQLQPGQPVIWDRPYNADAPPMPLTAPLRVSKWEQVHAFVKEVI